LRAINGGRSQTAVIEYLELWNILQHISLNAQPDKLIWRWTPDGAAYNMLYSGAILFRGHKLIWKAWAPLRVKIFLWLAMKHRHWTADRRARHGLRVWMHEIIATFATKLLKQLTTSLRAAY
jgi:hypothetical protein